MAENSTRTSDVLIIGGGIIGCSAAWRLAQAGLRVTVLDRAEPGSEASSAAAGMLAPFGEMVEPQVFADLCLASRNLYPRFAAEIQECSGQDVGYRGDGALLAALDREMEEELAEIHRAQTAQGFALHSLGAAEVHDRMAGLSPEVRSGLFIPGDHWIDNERLMRALITVCRRAGVCVESGCEVYSLRAQGNHIESVAAGSQESFAAGAYVLAAGSWSGKIAETLGMRLTVTPCRGQIMEFQSDHDFPFVVRSGIHYLVPRPGRRVLLGTTAEYAGFRKDVTAAGMHSILSGVGRLAPMVNALRFLRTWAGLRPDTSDHLPILGYGEIKNLVFATGHFRNGILLAPETAEIVRDLILTRSTARPLDAYHPNRFIA